MKKIKIVFMGTPFFAVPSLEYLAINGYEVCAVVTQTDKKCGRGNELSKSPVKIAAERLNLPVIQPDDPNSHEFIEELKLFEPDMIIVVAYGKILKRQLLDVPVYGAYNIHFSILPYYRGATPIQSSLMHGDDETGVTLIEINEKMDEGDIYGLKTIAVSKEDDAGTLHEKLAYLGAELLGDCISGIADGTITGEKQNDSLATYTKKITTDTEQINWKKSADDIANLVRALSPWPGAFSYLKRKRVKIWRAEVQKMAEVKNMKPGQVVQVLDDSLLIATGKGILKIYTLQQEGKKKMEVPIFCCGNSISLDCCFGLDEDE